MKKIYLDELEDIGNELVKYSEKDISEKINELKTLTKDFDWEGNGYDTFIEEYNKKINKVMEWNNNLSKLASFLLDVKSDYKNTNDKVTKSYENLIDEIEKIKKELGSE